MQSSIFAQIRLETDDFFNRSISPMPGYSFNQYNTIKRAILYLNSKYEDGTQFLGRDKLFFNVLTPAVEVATKMLNMDTKNIRLWPLNPKSHFSTYLLEKELKLWLKKSEMGQVLNRIAEEAPRYGSIVLEKCEEGAKVVDIRRLIMDPSVECIDDSRFVTTVHYMTPAELLDTGWDNVDVAIDRFGTTDAQQPFEDNRGNINQQSSTPYVKVTKRYGEVPEWWIDGGKSTKLVRSLFIVAGADQQAMSSDNKPVGELGVVLFKSKWRKEWPFKDFHYHKVKGRWLGLGVPEMLFDVQVRFNELKNQKRISMELSSMHLFQTSDKQIVRNVLTDVENGDIMLTGNNGIQPIANEERNLPAFQDEEASYLAQADRLTFAYEAVRGETQDNQVTLGQTQIASAQATSVYAFKKENLALFLQDFFNELVLPQLLKDLTPEHIMRFTGSVQELDKLDEAASEVYANDYAKNIVLGGNVITPQEIQAAKALAKETYRKMGESRYIKIKDAFYDDAEFEFDFLVTNEQENVMGMAMNLKDVINTVIGNPQALSDPRVKVLYYKYLERVGISPGEIELADQQSQQMPLQANPQQNGQPIQAGPQQAQAAPALAQAGIGQ